MRVLFFGSYEPDYSRNRVLLKGLKKNGVEVIECNDHSRYPKIFLKYPKLIKKYRSDCDAVVVGYPGYCTLPLAKLLTKLNRKPLLFDVFFSIYDNFVFTRKLVKENSLKAKFIFNLEKFACQISDVILVDTYQHVNYFHTTFGTEREKIKRVFVGTDDEVFYPHPPCKEDENFLVIFYGTFIQLHGIQHIIKAAKLLEPHKDIKFEILGSGQTYDEILSLTRRLNAKNVAFKKPVRYEELPNFIVRGDVCLGIFGDTTQTKNVIPNKAFETLAMKKPLITGDTPAIRESEIVHRENAFLVRLADSNALANAILELKEDEKLRNKIAKNGRKLFEKKFTPKIIGAEMKKILQEIINKKRLGESLARRR